MLYKAKALKDFKLHSRDGEIGRVKEFYFDDRHWTIRYLIADTGDWLMDRKVLISPHALIAVIQEEKKIAVDLTNRQIENSPLLSTDKPVSQQFEEAYYGYYDWPIYWDGPHAWGAVPYLVRNRTQGEPIPPGEKKWDPHLRSTHEMNGYHTQATDGEIGHVSDFVVDDETWSIRYLIIETRNWWPGKKVLVAPQWIEEVSWKDGKIFTSLSREAIQQSPAYSDEAMLTRDYEAGLHRHYKRQGYWADEKTAKQHSK